MRAVQQLLFPDARPLVERLGRGFFLSLPESAGVYFMFDATDLLLYVGKARNLRKRVSSYRVANPDRLPRRLIRLLARVSRIEVEVCASESHALAREAELLKTLRPPFNRAGTWLPQPSYFQWRRVEHVLELAWRREPEPGTAWHSHGPALGLAHAWPSLVRLLWSAANPALRLADLPAGWFRGATARALPIASATPDHARALGGLLETLAREAGAESSLLSGRAFALPFEQAVWDEDLDRVRQFFRRPLALEMPGSLPEKDSAPVKNSLSLLY